MANMNQGETPLSSFSSPEVTGENSDYITIHRLSSFKNFWDGTGIVLLNSIRHLHDDVILPL